RRWTRWRAWAESADCVGAVRRPADGSHNAGCRDYDDNSCGGRRVLAARVARVAIGSQRSTQKRLSMSIILKQSGCAPGYFAICSTRCGTVQTEERGMPQQKRVTARRKVRTR